MESISIILILLLAVILSSFIARMLPFSLPRPLLQVALGAVIGFSSHLRVALDPDIFFLLFLPPLLFLDGWRIPKEELSKDRGTILELALGLVIFTVVGMGFFIHWMIPAMPLPVAFALAAILSPTDPIAVSAIVQRVPIPRRMMHILEGESLLNDASGLVCFRFAIAAMLTGEFYLSEAATSFAWVAVGGLLIGFGLTFAVAWLKDQIALRFGEDSGSQVLISLLIPFGAYLLAEHFGCSGILAAVAAGVTMSAVENSGRALAATRLRRTSVWDTIQIAGNGIIFVLLGEQLPTILAGSAEIVRVTGHREAWWLAIYVFGLTLGLAVLRFAWVFISFWTGVFRRSSTGARLPMPNWRLVAAMSVAGVRGAITLAGVLTMPLALTDGSPFPGRDVAIFLAMGVIIVSLILASVALPLLLRNLDMPLDPIGEAAEFRARIAAAEAAIAEIERVQHRLAEGRKDADIYVDVAARVMDVYRQRIESMAGTDLAVARAKQVAGIEREIRLAAVKAERIEIFRRVREDLLGSDLARKLVRELDLLETRYSV